MEFKFKIQPYQTAAADAVTDVFAGQPLQGDMSYLRDLGTAKTKRGMESMLAYDAGGEEGYANAPVALKPADILKNIRGIQHVNQIQESKSLFKGSGACTLDVEMETGTGKTYVYTKTMFELNKAYGWTKFIVVVPSVAIREGVYKSLQTTEQHFFEQYGKSIKYFIYNSDRLNDLDSYSESSDINCMVINMQAFNSSMKEGAKNKAARIIFDERDEFGSRRPIDVIAGNRPIVIVDEPQKMGKKGSATQKGIERFNPLFVLNYSATHKEHHDTVFVLDALDAFNQKLVKRIEVKGFELKNMRGTDGYLYLKDIIVSKHKAPEAVIEFKYMAESGKVKKKTLHFNEGDSIYDASGSTRLEVYRDFVIASGNDGIVPDQDGRPGYVRFLNGVQIYRGEVYGDSAEEDLRRVQIRETIASHLLKEEALFHRGIKCLSLFFIDEVAKYRDISGNGETVGYGKIFEEEYEAAVQERLRHPTAEDLYDNSYVRYLASFDTKSVHSGYFSIDKKGGLVDSKEKKAELEDGLGANDEDAKRAYDLILKDKERLLSFEEPVRFIFSHSTLREGWDNPNIFQICTLKSSGSETGKRQEVGRGLRLCVDKDGSRQDLTALGEREVHQVNVLTVIASESYRDFTADLQKDIQKTLRDRPAKVEADFFSGRDIMVQETGAKVSFDGKESSTLYKYLIKNDLIDGDSDRPSDKFREQVESGTFVEYALVSIPGMSEEKLTVAQNLLASVYDPNALDPYIKNGVGSKVLENSVNENWSKPEFQQLWEQIRNKYAYTVSFDDAMLRQRAIANINANLTVSELAYTLTTGAQKDGADRTDLSMGQSFKVGSTETKDLDVSMSTGVTYDLLGEIAEGAQITRRSAAAILSGISPLQFGLFKRNPEEFIKKAAKLIVEEKAQLIVDGIQYRQIDEKFDQDIFSKRMPESIAKAIQTEKNVQDYVFWDSQVEHDFAHDLESAKEVCVYARLPRSFQIPTPVGYYAPDWAIAFNKGSVKHVFFIAETKGSISQMDTSVVENAKIACAKKVFNELSTTDVRYHNVSSYDEALRYAKDLLE